MLRPQQAPRPHRNAPSTALPKAEGPSSDPWAPELRAARARIFRTAEQVIRPVSLLSQHSLTLYYVAKLRWAMVQLLIRLPSPVCASLRYVRFGGSRLTSNRGITINRINAPSTAHGGQHPAARRPQRSIIKHELCAGPRRRARGWRWGIPHDRRIGLNFIDTSRVTSRRLLCLLPCLSHDLGCHPK